MEVKRIGPGDGDQQKDGKKKMTKLEKLRKLREPKKIVVLREELPMKMIVPSESRAVMIEATTSQDFFGSTTS